MRAFTTILNEILVRRYPSGIAWLIISKLLIIIVVVEINFWRQKLES